MKKTICLILSMIIILATATSTIATSDITYQYGDTIVVFGSETTFSATEREYIADMLVYGESDITMVQPRAWCWLTGHDKTTEYVTIITHKKYATEPRCLKERYEVTTCANCDLYDMVLVNSTDISCCPVD